MKYRLLEKFTGKQVTKTINLGGATLMSCFTGSQCVHHTKTFTQDITQKVGQCTLREGICFRSVWTVNSV